MASMKTSFRNMGVNIRNASATTRDYFNRHPTLRRNVITGVSTLGILVAGRVIGNLSGSPDLDILAKDLSDIGATTYFAGRLENSLSLSDDPIHYPAGFVKTSARNLAQIAMLTYACIDIADTFHDYSGDAAFQQGVHYIGNGLAWVGKIFGANYRQTAGAIGLLGGVALEKYAEWDRK